MSLFPQPTVSAFADVLIALLRDRPHEWRIDRVNCVLEHPSGLGVWTGNGFWFCKLYRPESITFGWKKIPLWLACRRVLKIANERAQCEKLNRLHSNLDQIVNNVVEFRKRAQ